MDAKKMKEIRQRLSTEYEKLIKSINPNRVAAEEIKMENTEDEGDLGHNQPQQRTLLQPARKRFRSLEVYPRSH